jgi:hypothetical protein
MSGYGQKPSRASAQLAKAQSLTRKLAEQAGPDAFGATTAGEHEARPRGEGDRDVEQVPGTKISYVVPPVIKRW